MHTLTLAKKNPRLKERVTKAPAVQETFSAGRVRDRKRGRTSLDIAMVSFLDKVTRVDWEHLTAYLEGQVMRGPTVKLFSAKRVIYLGDDILWPADQ